MMKKCKLVIARRSHRKFKILAVYNIPYDIVAVLTEHIETAIKGSRKSSGVTHGIRSFESTTNCYK